MSEKISARYNNFLELVQEHIDVFLEPYNVDYTLSAERGSFNAVWLQLVVKGRVRLVQSKQVDNVVYVVPLKMDDVTVYDDLPESVVREWDDDIMSLVENVAESMVGDVEDDWYSQIEEKLGVENVKEE